MPEKGSWRKTRKDRTELALTQEPKPTDKSIISVFKCLF